MTSKRDSILEASAKAIAERGVRGLRVNDVAEYAGVSPGLLYYHFSDRAGLLGAALHFVNERARSYRGASVDNDDSPRARLEAQLLDEFQDDPLVIENSRAWEELRSSAIFEEELRAPVAQSTVEWVAEIADAIIDAQESGEVDTTLDAHRAALSLSIFMEGLDGRWLCDELPTADIRALMSEALAQVLGAAKPAKTKKPAPTGRSKK